MEKKSVRSVNQFFSEPWIDPKPEPEPERFNLLKG